MDLTEKKILLVDDEERLLNSISKRISLLGVTPLTALSGIEAIEIAKTTHIDLAIVDLKMPDMDGLVTIAKLKEIIPNLRTILLTGYGNEKTKQATEALGSIYIEKDSMGGLWDIIRSSSKEGKIVVIKPSASPGRQTKNDTSHQIEILNSNPYGETRQERLINPDNKNKQMVRPLTKIIGETPEIQRLKKNIERFSEMDCAIIIKGESGTGKELVARKIHNLSHRRHQHFLAFDCGCFSSDFRFCELVDSFEGRGAYNQTEDFTSTKKKKSFSGTIFLDHIENMPTQTQQEMMELLDGKVISTNQQMNIRFIVVAYLSQKEKVSKGKFQKELFSRLRAIEIEVPPLRQRKEDIPILSHYFLDLLNKEFNKKIKTISDDVFLAFRQYSFPGNVRELKHIIERAVILSKGQTITTDHLPERLKHEEPKIVPNEDATFLTIHQMEQNHILKALEITKGNKSKAAEILGISRAALWRKLRLISEDS